MSSMQENAYCVFEYSKTSLVTVVQRHFRTNFREEPPHRHNISRWVKQFQDTGCLYKNKNPRRKETKPEVIERINDSFLRGVPQNQRDVQVQNWLSLTQRRDVFYGSVSNSSRTYIRWSRL
ncbi:DUF4817 domain-containing protein [Trichonephila clavata]|uniref:DUF4817 domain-containing protein n=1 Tax=Trichonephila clavata TaxID=2740835 RepID=A0A8X6IFF3_TRICU|nr:DUF4817 domain-containing protein [Trichonephila clavata]